MPGLVRKVVYAVLAMVIGFIFWWVGQYVEVHYWPGATDLFFIWLVALVVSSMLAEPADSKKGGVNP